MQCQSLGQSTVLGGRIVGEQGSPYKDHMDGVSGVRFPEESLENWRGWRGGWHRETIDNSAGLLSAGVLYSDYCILKGMLSQDS